MREKLFNNSWTRTEKGDANDTRAIIPQLAQLRAQKAKLLGYPNYAAYVLYDQMAKTPQAVQNFIGQLVPATAAKAADEAKQIQAMIDKARQAFRSQAVGLGAAMPRRCARPNTISTRTSSSPISSSTRCCRTACSMPPTSSTASRSRSVTTFRSISRTCACSTCSTRTARSSA